MTSGICLPYRHSVFSTRPIFAWRLQDFFHLVLGHVVISNVVVAGRRVDRNRTLIVQFYRDTVQSGDDEGR
jgi:hypothetical protein